MVFEQEGKPDEARRAYLQTIAAGKPGDPIVTVAKLRKALLRFRRIRST
jgi:hypothetical protein